MSKIGRSANKHGNTQTVIDHLTSVAELTGKIASKFDKRDLGFLTGLFHDIGKYGTRFQGVLTGQQTKIDHSSIGAILASIFVSQQAATAIGGHHTEMGKCGFDSYDQLKKSYERDEVVGGVKYSSNVKLGDIWKEFVDDHIKYKGSKPKTQKFASGLVSTSRMLDTRMLFSALVDADRLDAESHSNADEFGNKVYRKQNAKLDAEDSLNKLLSFIGEVSKNSKSSHHVNKMREDLLNSCLESARKPPGVFTLTAPTGTGKTLSVLAFALKHALVNNHERIIMVVPYLSIIEQTATIYKKILGENYIFEHHSLATGSQTTPTVESEFTRMMLSETWDSPVIITTNVQFLESLFSSRPSQCRKLHNVTNSVIIFDESQNLSSDLIIPTLASFNKLVDDYKCSIVLATATQPAFENLSEMLKEKEKEAKGWSSVEIVDQGMGLFKRAKRVNVNTPKDQFEKINNVDLALEISKFDSCLCIVNMKRHARNLVDELRKLDLDKKILHLSTNMCQAHRAVVLNYVRESTKCIMVSTQCIEAGVDIDFNVVYRALAPLEAITQAAGRCNRNKNLDGLGEVKVFIPEIERYPDGYYGNAAKVTLGLALKYGCLDIDDENLFKEYYKLIYDINGIKDEKIYRRINSLDFPGLCKEYKIIKTDAVNVLVPWDVDQFLVFMSEARNGISKKWMKKVQQHVVSVPRNKVYKMSDKFSRFKVLSKKYKSDDWFYLEDEQMYNKIFGLDLFKGDEE